MPEISRFFGIVISMYFNDHNPPHFHAAYGRRKVIIGIDPIIIIAGGLPTRALSMVLEWAALHQRELMDNWNRLRATQAPRPVSPLD